MSLPHPDGDRGVYGISVAADLAGMGVQTLRLYETRGLLQPARTKAAPAATAPKTSTGSAGSATYSTPG